jgi:hypothetical protein
MKNLCKLLVILLAGILPIAARADQPGAHPRYLHALSDLRAARANIEKRGGDLQMKWDEATAIAEIDAAIHEIKAAAIDDGKDLNDHPPIDAHMKWGGRLHHARELLQSAHSDIKEHESNDFAHGLRDRVLKHIDKAIHFVDQGIANSK